MIMDKKAIANIFNDYFVNIARGLIKMRLQVIMGEILQSIQA